MNVNIHRKDDTHKVQLNTREQNVNKSSPTNTDIDDVFDQTDDVNHEQQFAQKQYDRYVGKFYNEGFREALSFLEDEAGAQPTNSENVHALQNSFDKGYETAFAAAKQFSTLRNGVKTYLEFVKDAPDLLSNNELTELKNIDIELDTEFLKFDELIKNGTGVSGNRK